MAISNRKQLADVFQALAAPTRMDVVQLLAKEPRRAGELALATGSSAAAMSKHLKVLLDVGVVEDERSLDDARARIFRLRPRSVDAVQTWLAQLQRNWDGQLAAFKQHVEKVR